MVKFGKRIEGARGLAIHEAAGVRFDCADRYFRAHRIFFYNFQRFVYFKTLVKMLTSISDGKALLSKAMFISH